MQASGGTLAIHGAFGGPGAVDLAAGSTLDLSDAQLALPKISFLGSDSTLILAQGQSFDGAPAPSIDGFSVGDHIAMTGIDAASFTAGNGKLTLSSGGHVVDTLHLAGSFAGDSFSVQQANGMGVVSLSHS